MPFAKRSSGFSLLELVLASLVFAFALGTVAAMWAYYDKSLAKSADRNAALFFAQTEMENCQRAGFRELEALATPSREHQLRWWIDDAEVVTVYRSRVQVESTRPELKEVLVEVSYGEDVPPKRVVLSSTIFWSD